MSRIQVEEIVGDFVKRLCPSYITGKSITWKIPWTILMNINPLNPPFLAITGLKNEQAVAPIAEINMTFLELYLSAKYPPGNIDMIKP